MTKQRILESFFAAGLKIDRIVESKLGGFYAYHPYGDEGIYRKYRTVKDTKERAEVERSMGWEHNPTARYKHVEGAVTRRSFISNEGAKSMDGSDFDENMLRMAIAEAKIRKGKIK